MAPGLLAVAFALASMSNPNVLVFVDWFLWQSLLTYAVKSFLRHRNLRFRSFHSLWELQTSI